MSYVIRNMDSQQELRSCAEMQREVWSFETPDIVSADMLEKIRQGGGIRHLADLVGRAPVAQERQGFADRVVDLRPLARSFAGKLSGNGSFRGHR